MLAASLSGFAQVQEHPRAAIYPAAGSVGRSNEAQQALILDGPVRQRSMHPSIETASRYAQNPAHRGSVVFGMMGMKEGGKRKLFIPAHLAYGERQIGDKIPANSDLTFEVDMLEVLTRD